MLTERITVATTGSAGSATGTAQSSRPVIGKILGIHVDYVSEPVTTLVSIASAGKNHPALTLLSLPAGNTDGWRHPYAEAIEPDATAITGSSVPLAITDYVTVTVTAGDPNASVVVTIISE